ncbi:MAG TPA: 50S ribosomal protein L30 [Acidobacteriaceae bacterium]
MAETQSEKPNAASSKASLRLQYYRSMIATPEKHKKVIKGLGFTRLNQVVEREDTPSVRGMVRTVPHLVRILEN